MRPGQDAYIDTAHGLNEQAEQRNISDSFTHGSGRVKRFHLQKPPQAAAPTPTVINTCTRSLAGSYLLERTQSL
jgi:hypothetical protein